MRDVCKTSTLIYVDFVFCFLTVVNFSLEPALCLLPVTLLNQGELKNESCTCAGCIELTLPFYDVIWVKKTFPLF